VDARRDRGNTRDYPRRSARRKLVDHGRTATAHRPVTRAASGRAPRASVPRGFIHHMGTAVLLGVALFTEEAKPSRGNVDDQACLQRLRGCDATIAVLWLPRQSPATASRAWRGLPGVREDSWQTTQLYARGHTVAAVPRDPTSRYTFGLAVSSCECAAPACADLCT